MQQYFQVKTKHPSAILLFRVGDFYETFGEDAVLTAQVLGIVLTSRNNGGSDIELAGFPFHALDTYLPRLIRAGHRVAICEQLEKPSPEKKIVKRGVTEIVTPGLAVDDKLLDHKTNNFLASLFFGKKDTIGIALLDISTGEFLVSEGSPDYIDKLLQSFRPSEIILSKDKKKAFQERFGERFHLFSLDEWVYSPDYTHEKLLTHFGTQSLKGFGVDDLELAPIAAGAILHYLETTENKNIGHLRAISRIQPDRYVWLDRFTIRNLELLFSPHENGVPLIKVLDLTISPMGGRLLKKWMVLPLIDPVAIEGRLSVVEYFTLHTETVRELSDNIRMMGDLERLISKVPLGKINPREVVHLQRALAAIPAVKEKLAQTGVDALAKIAQGLDDCPTLVSTIQQQITEDPPVNLSKGGVIADGFSAELDDLRDIMKNGRNRLVDIKEREVERTGISSLKIGFNNVFGYYLEVTNKCKNEVPADWVRKQTLTNGERFITDELKQLEDKILGAEEKMLTLRLLFEQLVLDMANYIPQVQRNAALIARLDCLLSFAKVAVKYHYCRPQIDNSLVIDIKEGRHPVIEQQLPIGEAYIPNDVYLDSEAQQVMMITGPNMSGKSALLRQTALICLLAQMGSFVPARSARIGVVDKVFTRVGASDNISSGESTFMVEMNETASIMNNISDRSLILLDEIGRGTSTYDGISIAWSIAEYLHNNGLARPKTLFATHYHELNELAEKFPRIHNYNVSVKEVGNKIIFLRKLAAGGSQHSFGIHVARLAGMPSTIVARANHILTQLEQKHIDQDDSPKGTPKAAKPATAQISTEAMQLSIFETVDPLAGQIKSALQDLQINNMTPIECMMKLNELKQLLDS
ncbi:MAG: DNA mismatch repair protein MutS [Saprospiraceae bacterium]